jgi:hypothetical protein
MTKTLALVLAGGVLGFAADAQAGTALTTPHPQRAEGPDGGPLALVLMGDDDGWLWSSGGHSGSDDGNGDSSRSDDCNVERDDNCFYGATGNAAPAGTVAPPSNGLFTDGTAPQVKAS